MYSLKYFPFSWRQDLKASGTTIDQTMKEFICHAVLTEQLQNI